MKNEKITVGRVAKRKRARRNKLCFILLLFIVIGTGFSFAQSKEEVIEYSQETILDEETNICEKYVKEEIEKQIEMQKQMQEQEYSNMKKLQNEMNKAYAQAYNDYWRSRGYKIKEPWTLKRFIELLKVLAIIAIIIAVIWFFPPTHKLIVDFYEGNQIIKTIVDILGNIFKGIGNAIVKFFQNTF